jgi:myo-inositol-1(or 4)-monophosphatase
MSYATTESKTEWQEWSAAAAGLALEAGGLLKRLLHEPRQMRSKGFRDIVTDGDFAAQQLITNGLRQRFPAHGFWAEEENPDLPTTGPVRWLIDPVDGTTNFSRNIPNFCVSIAATVSECVVAGVIYDPMSDELFCAVRGQGATLNGQPMHVSVTAEVSEATVANDWGRRQITRERSYTAVSRLVHRVRTLRTFGSSALTLAWVAAGRLDAHVAFELGAWDIAAGSLLIQEAGGCITTIENDPLPLAHSTTCYSSNGLLHLPLLAVIQGLDTSP